jgi:hypothetical protein
MAQRRMISKSISTSRKLARVSDRAALLFTWLQPHTDDYGRMEGDPPTVRARVVPMRKWTDEHVETALEELVKAGLLYWYEAEGEQYVEIVAFEEHQTFKNDRPRRAEYPGRPADSDGIQNVPDGNNRPRKLSEGKLSEVKGILSGENPAQDLLPSNASAFIRFFSEATQAIRKVKPEIDGAKDGSLIKTRLKKLGGEMDRLEQMAIWYLTRKKRVQDGKQNWRDEFKNPPAISTMLSTSYFNQLLSEEANARSYMAENIEWVSKVYRKGMLPTTAAKADKAGVDLKALLADRFRIEPVETY